MLRSLPRQEDKYVPKNITDIFQMVTRKAGGNFQVTTLILDLIL